MTRKIVCAALALCMAVAMLPTLSQAEVRLTYANFFPPTHVQSQLAEEWCREVEKRSGGAVAFDYFPGGTLTKAKQTYDGVVEGIADVGMSALAYSRGRFPVMAAIDLPLGYTSGVQATDLANAVYAEFRPEELDEVEVMYFHAHGPGLLHTRKVAVHKIEDMKGLKIRATGNSARVVESLGATPVAMSMPDSYQSLRKGVVDGGMYPVETNKGWKMGEVVDYMTVTTPAAYTTTFFVVMNKDKFEALPQEARDAIAAVNAEWGLKHGQAWDEADVQGMAFFKEQGNEVIELDEAEAARWKAAVRPMVDGYGKELDDKGLKGTEVMEFISVKMAE